LSGGGNRDVHDDHLPVFRSDAFRRLPYEVRGFIILVNEGIKPAADFEVDEQQRGDLEALLRLLAISFEGSEIEGRQGSKTKYFISKSKFRAKRLARLDKVFSKGWSDEDGILTSEAGGLYGIPSCCLSSYLLRTHGGTKSKSSVEPGDNPLQHPDEFRYLFYIPCSAGCLESKELGWQIRQALERLDSAAATRWREGKLAT